MACNPYEPLAEWEIALLFQDTVTTSEQDVVDAIFGPPSALPFSSRQASLHPSNCTPVGSPVPGWSSLDLTNPYNYG